MSILSGQEPHRKETDITTVPDTCDSPIGHHGKFSLEGVVRATGRAYRYLVNYLGTYIHKNVAQCFLEYSLKLIKKTQVNTFRYTFPKQIIIHL